MTSQQELSPPGMQLQGQVNQQQALTQRMIMSAHMQQAIALLQIPIMELGPFIEEQAVLNPVLEIEDPKDELDAEDQSSEPEQGEDLEQEVEINDHDLSILTRLDDDLRDFYSTSDTMPIKRSTEEEERKSYMESSICAEPTLHSQLMQLARETFSHPDELAIAEILIGYIDHFGFLKTPIEEICLLHNLSEGAVKQVLAEIQTFEPYGVGAASIQEALLLQLKGLRKDQTLAYQIVRDHYDELIHNHIPQIQKSLHCSFEEIQHAISQDIAKLDLHPGTHFAPLSKQTIIPDVTIRCEGEGNKLVVEVERDWIPSLRLNSQYLHMLNDPQTPLETKQYIKKMSFRLAGFFVTSNSATLLSKELLRVSQKNKPIFSLIPKVSYNP